MVKFEDVFEDHWKIEEILLEGKFLKATYGYIGSTLVDSCDDHVSVVLGYKKWVACFVPFDMPNDLFRKHSS